VSARVRFIRLNTGTRVRPVQIETVVNLVNIVNLKVTRDVLLPTCRKSSGPVFRRCGRRIVTGRAEGEGRPIDSA
jgi:hypothetical protein